MANASNAELTRLWDWVTTNVKQRITQPSLWRAMEAATPIALEGDSLVLGFEQNLGAQAGLLRDNVNRNTIEQLLESALKRRVKLHLISGTTSEDWANEKQQLDEARRLESARQAARSRGYDDVSSWEAIGDRVVRRYSALSNRALPSVQAEFLEEAIDVVVEAYPSLMGSPDEVELRNYNRVIDRIAERTGVPQAMIAFLVRSRLNPAMSSGEPQEE